MRPSSQVASPACQPHRIRVRRPEERLRGGRAPVDHEARAISVGEPEAPDKDRFVDVTANHPPEARVHAVPSQCAQARRQAVDLEVTVERLLPRSAGCRALRCELPLDVGNRPRESRLERREVLLVGRDEGGVILRRKPIGKAEYARRNSHDR